MQYCSVCSNSLESDGKVRKRLRPRKCGECIRKTSPTDPVKVLSHRFNVALKRSFPKEARPEHWSVETVKFVLKRFNFKSCISDEDNLNRLCLCPYEKLDRPPEADEIVLVTSKEAQRISKTQSSEERKANFPLHIQHLMNKTRI